MFWYPAALPAVAVHIITAKESGQDRALPEGEEKVLTLSFAWDCLPRMETSVYFCVRFFFIFGVNRTAAATRPRIKVTVYRPMGLLSPVAGLLGF